MLSFLKSDNTWLPEQEENFFVIRANKNLEIDVNDFVEYTVGVRFEFPQDYRLNIKIHPSYQYKLFISNNIVLKSNYSSPKQTTIILTNVSKEAVLIKNTDKLLICNLESNNIPVIEKKIVAPIINTKMKEEKPKEIIVMATSHTEPMVESNAKVAIPQKSSSSVEPAEIANQSNAEVATSNVEEKKITETFAEMTVKYESSESTTASEQVKSENATVSEEEEKPKRRYIRKKTT